jgi:hypothetical protein
MNSAPRSISGTVVKDAYIENTKDMKASFVHVVIEVTGGRQKGEFETIIIERDCPAKPEKALNPEDSRRKPPAYIEAGTPVTFSSLRRQDNGVLVAGFTVIHPKPAPAP